MKLLLVVALISLTVVASFPLSKQFEDWTRTNKKRYSSVSETVSRFEAFKANAAFVAQHNAEAKQGLHSFVVGLNRFADMTNDEYRVMLGYQRSANRTSTGKPFRPTSVSDLPPTVDWRTKGIVTPVKDQGQCGSCWSFSATGSMEGAHALSTGNLVSLSEQNLVDCVNNGQDTCETGGEMTDAFQWVISNGGIEGESDYPYCACSGNGCQFDPSLVQATFSSYTSVSPQGDEGALQVAAAQQPVSIAIDASAQSFQLYSGGVYNNPDCSSTDLDHGVLIVGYGNYQGSDYWLVKNSWSASWGMDGYIMMTRNENNQCGVATDASYPTV